MANEYNRYREEEKEVASEEEIVQEETIETEEVQTKEKKKKEKKQKKIEDFEEYHQMIEEIAKLKDELLRNRAELENFKRRSNEERIKYLNGYYDYYTDGKNKYWSKEISDNPENLLFWFDFLDAEGSDIAKYSVPVIGSRTKAINDKDVKSIYYREIPTTIF